MPEGACMYVAPCLLLEVKTAMGIPGIWRINDKSDPTELLKQGRTMADTGHARRIVAHAWSFR